MRGTPGQGEKVRKRMEEVCGDEWEVRGGEGYLIARDRDLDGAVHARDVRLEILRQESLTYT